MMLLTFVASFLLITPALFSEERVPVGSRPMSEEVSAEIESRKKVPVEEEVADPQDNETMSLGFVFDRYPPIYYSDSHHWLTAVTILDQGNYTLELEDGSIWKINSYDGIKAVNWRSNDPLTITQNNRWFSWHNYRIINKANGTSVEATLFLGPIEHGEFSRFIIEIDHANGQILLSDNTRWEISYIDASIFREWRLHDYVILGTNSDVSLWDSGSDALLINVNLNNTVRAKQF